MWYRKRTNAHPDFSKLELLKGFQDILYLSESCMYASLSQYPEHQDKCREEADALFDGKGSEEFEWFVFHMYSYILI